MSAPSQRDNSVAIEARDLACERGGRLILSGVSFRIEAGCMLALTGPNGAGKSSLLRMLAGLIRPSAGNLYVEARSKEDAVIHHLGHADPLKPALTLREMLRFWSAIYRQQGRVPLDADFEETAGVVGLRHALDLPTGIFSAGQRRRVSLARLILSPRPLWLLDEPTSALDEDGERLLGALMLKHLTAGGLIVAATHQALPVPADQTLKLGGET